MVPPNTFAAAAVVPSSKLRRMGCMESGNDSRRRLLAVIFESLASSF
jgi:hypothetical protein